MPGASRRSSAGADADAVRGAWPPQAWTLERNLVRNFGDHPDEAYLPGWDFSVIKKAESRSDGSLACTIDRSSECGYTKYSSHIVIYSDFLMDRRRNLFGFPHGPATSPDSHRSPPLTVKSGEETLARKLTPGRTHPRRARSSPAASRFCAFALRWHANQQALQPWHRANLRTARVLRSLRRPKVHPVWAQAGAWARAW